MANKLLPEIFENVMDSVKLTNDGKFTGLSIEDLKKLNNYLVDLSEKKLINTQLILKDGKLLYKLVPTSNLDKDLDKEMIVKVINKLNESVLLNPHTFSLGTNYSGKLGEIKTDISSNPVPNNLYRKYSANAFSNVPILSGLFRRNNGLNVIVNSLLGKPQTGGNLLNFRYDNRSFQDSLKEKYGMYEKINKIIDTLKGNLKAYNKELSTNTEIKITTLLGSLKDEETKLFEIIEILYGVNKIVSNVGDKVNEQLDLADKDKAKNSLARIAPLYNTYESKIITLETVIKRMAELIGASAQTKSVPSGFVLKIPELAATSGQPSIVSVFQPTAESKPADLPSGQPSIVSVFPPTAESKPADLSSGSSASASAVPTVPKS